MTHYQWSPSKYSPSLCLEHIYPSFLPLPEVILEALFPEGFYKKQFLKTWRLMLMPWAPSNSKADWGRCVLIHLTHWSDTLWFLACLQSPDDHEREIFLMNSESWGSHHSATKDAQERELPRLLQKVARIMWCVHLKQEGIFLGGGVHDIVSFTVIFFKVWTCSRFFNHAYWSPKILGVRILAHSTAV